MATSDMALSLGWMFICHEQNEIVRIQDKPGLSVKLMEYGSDKVMIHTTTIVFMIVILLFGPKLFWNCSYPDDSEIKPGL